MGVTTSSTVAATYEPLIAYTLPSNAASVTLGSGGQGTIPQTYTDLVLIVNASMTSGGNTVYCRVNGDTGFNYSLTYLGGNGSSAYSSRASNSNDGFDLGGYQTGFTTGMYNIVAQFMNYSNTTTYKTCLSRWNDATSGGTVEASVNLWRNTNAITSLLVRTNGSMNFNSGSTFTLYGIKAA